MSKAYLIHNLEQKMGASPQYWATLLEWPKDYDEEKIEGGTAVALFTPAEMERALRRAKNNPEDVDQFLKNHTEK